LVALRRKARPASSVRYVVAQAVSSPSQGGDVVGYGHTDRFGGLEDRLDLGAGDLVRRGVGRIRVAHDGGREGGLVDEVLAEEVGDHTVVARGVDAREGNDERCVVGAGGVGAWTRSGTGRVVSEVSLTTNE
jgi:hypothetical protein